MALEESIGLWVGALLTLMAFSYVYKETYLYRFVEHTLIGAAAGYVVSLGIKNIREIIITPLLAGAYVNVIPLVLGVLLYARFVRGYTWASRWMLALIVGVGAALPLRGSIEADIVRQIATSNPVLNLAQPYQLANTLIVIVAVCTTLLYFTFTVEHKGVIGVAAKIGMYLMMIALGANFGNGYASRMAYLIGRLQYLLVDWLGIAT